ncbi:MAG: 50S ribosomal protein L6 [Puniceicoccaceae bacterium]
MSRIGKLPVAIPEKVSCKIEGNTVTIKGPKGELTKSFHSSVSISENEGQIEVTPRDSSRLAKAMYGTARSILNGMVIGVVDGYSKQIEISGVGFKAEVKGDILDLSLGYSHPIHHKIPEGVAVTMDGNTKMKIEGIDKQVVGQLAASVKQYFPMEPYKGKGVRIVGEFVRRKEGKKTA